MCIFDVYVATFFVSTSNRNVLRRHHFSSSLLHFLFLHQTATSDSISVNGAKLLHFLFLHQTATGFVFPRRPHKLLHFLFLHQTATAGQEQPALESCYIFCFYIKPQQEMINNAKNEVATFFVSTSNRNMPLIWLS